MLAVQDPLNVCVAFNSKSKQGKAAKWASLSAKLSPAKPAASKDDINAILCVSILWSKHKGHLDLDLNIQIDNERVSKLKNISK